MTASAPIATGGLYDFPVREYSTQGRWASPDPAGLAATDPSDPQSFNRYSYVRNRPLSSIDQFGLFCNYKTDDDSDIESQDFFSTEEECAATGGEWVPSSG